MKIFTYISSVLTLLILGASYLRSSQYGLMISCILLIFLLFYKRQWVLYVISGVLFYGVFHWWLTALKIARMNEIMGEDSTRMFVILGSVAFVTLCNAAILHFPKFRANYKKVKYQFGIMISFLLTMSLLVFTAIKVSFPILLFDRIYTNMGWLQVFLLSLYAAYVTEKMLDPKLTPKWRRRIWLTFSIIFFGQLALGLMGFEMFLMSGKLHIPVPAIILAGPLYRWELSFMVFLFLGSIVFSGPAWCSHLCYFGVWDNLAADIKPRPSKLTKKVWHIRIGLFLGVVAVALLFNLLGISIIGSIIAGILFGAVGIAVIIIFSRKTGNMVHCTTYCPIGILAVIFGKVSPFRIKINENCTTCMKCHYVCRYNALNLQDIKNGKPNLNCTLCGDCISPCEHSSINYSLFKFKPEISRAVFIVVIVSLHAVFLGLGRI